MDINQRAKKIFEDRQNGRKWESLDEGAKSYYRYLARVQEAAEQKAVLKAN